MQWLDTEQSDFDKRYVEMQGRGGFAWLRGGKREEKKEGGAEGNSQSPGDART
jgi:hypothetical protein